MTSVLLTELLIELSPELPEEAALMTATLRCERCERCEAATEV